VPCLVVAAHRGLPHFGAGESAPSISQVCYASLTRTHRWRWDPKCSPASRPHEVKAPSF